MVKSLGDYMLEQSSLSGAGNIKWTRKNPIDKELKKKKTSTKTSTNIIYTDDVKLNVEKIFKIKNSNAKSKKEKASKRFQTSSASNFKIIPGFSRKGR